MRSNSKLLTHVDTELELNMIKGLFEDNDIPLLIEKEGTGSYLAVHSGFNYQGTNVYVSETDYEKSVDLLAALQDIKPSDEEVEHEAWEEGYEEDNVNKRRKYALLFIIVPVVIFVLAMLGTILAYLIQI